MRTLLTLLLTACSASALADPIDVDQIKKDLAKIDRELRADTPAVPDFGKDKPFGRINVEIEDAYIGTGEDARSYYEAPDGTVYYMETIKGKTRCSMTGAVGSFSGKSNGASGIQCPASTADWKKY
jgi:hypothetical protein